MSTEKSFQENHKLATPVRSPYEKHTNTDRHTRDLNVGQVTNANHIGTDIIRQERNEHEEEGKKHF